jgi:hypothetical protein
MAKKNGLHPVQKAHKPAPVAVPNSPVDFPEVSWEVHTESTLSEFKLAYDGGNSRGLWEAIVFCNDTRTPQPEWVRDTLIGLINGRTLKRKNGRPSDWIDDLQIFYEVEYWRQQRIVSGKVKKTKGFSKLQAFEMIRQKKGWTKESIGTIREKYERAREAMTRDPKPFVSPFLEPK